MTLICREKVQFNYWLFKIEFSKILDYIGDSFSNLSKIVFISLLGVDLLLILNVTFVCIHYAFKCNYVNCEAH